MRELGEQAELNGHLRGLPAVMAATIAVKKDFEKWKEEG